MRTVDIIDDSEIDKMVSVKDQIIKKNNDTFRQKLVDDIEPYFAGIKSKLFIAAANGQSRVTWMTVDKDIEDVSFHIFIYHYMDELEKRINNPRIRLLYTLAKSSRKESRGWFRRTKVIRCTRYKLDAIYYKSVEEREKAIKKENNAAYIEALASAYAIY